MKIVVLTCAWLRYDITKIFLEQIKVLQEYKPDEFEVELVVVGSKGKCEQQVKPYTKHYIHHQNLPLGKKWNAGLKYCQQLNFDFLLALGSDDIISTSALDVYKRYADEGYEYIGWKDFYLINTEKKIMKYWKGYEGKRSGESVGAGRLISRNILEQLDFKLWNDNKNKGLDGTFTKRINSVKHKSISVSARNNLVFMVDLKSRVNLGGYEKSIGNQVSIKRLIPAHFSNHIYKMIMAL
jgi:hypothetical protein